MKKIFSIILICFLSINLLMAQETCITPSPLPPSWIFQKSASQKSIQLNSVSGVITLNIFVHIVRSTNGQGLNTSILSTILSNLNNSFTSSNIQFSLAGSDYIDNDNFYGNLVGKENQLFGINIHTNAINIYVLGTSTNWGAAGMAQSIPSIAYIVHGNYYNTSSLPHEMGHCLGLYHTHHGTVTETGGDINQCSELVSGSNSTTCGDYISDTRADPNVWSSNSCNYSGTLTDANGQFYNPDPSNLMSYSYKPCRNLFTPLQSDRMNNFILNTQILQNVIHYEISGPSQICNQGTFTINNLPAGATVTWSYSTNLQIQSTSTNSATFQAIWNGQGNVSATILIGTTQIQLAPPTFWVGVPNQPTNISFYPYIPCLNQEVIALVIANNPEISNVHYEWSGGSHDYVDYSFNGSEVHFTTLPRLAYTTNVTVKAVNECGCSFDYTKLLTVKKCGGGIPPAPAAASINMQISPNPANDLVTVSVTENLNYQEESSSNLKKTETVLLTDFSGEFEIQLWNEYFGLIKTLKSNQPKLQISLRGLTNGMYYLQLIVDGKVVKKQIILKR